MHVTFLHSRVCFLLLFFIIAGSVFRSDVIRCCRGGAGGKDNNRGNMAKLSFNALCYPFFYIYARVLDLVPLFFDFMHLASRFAIFRVAPTCLRGGIDDV